VKRIILITAAAFFLFLFCGCQPEKESAPPGIAAYKPKESGNSFPDFLVGTWKADKAEWMFSFEADGTISSLRHFIGVDIDVSEGGAVEQLRDEVTAVYFLGPCEAVYTPATRQLDLTIILENFYVEFPTFRIVGNSKDYLKGPISQDGRQWKVNWLSYGAIEGAKQPDPNSIRPKFITFTKTQDDVRQ
jgi:hypothetical protein